MKKPKSSRESLVMIGSVCSGSGEHTRMPGPGCPIRRSSAQRARQQRLMMNQRGAPEAYRHRRRRHGPQCAMTGTAQAGYPVMARMRWYSGCSRLYNGR